MENRAAIIEYLNGNKFDSGKIFTFNLLGYSGNRMACVANEILKDKKSSVVHLGACDHLELIAKKRKENTWCHEILMNHSARVLGIDINKAAVDYCEKEGIHNIIYANMLTDQADIRKKMKMGGYWDYLFAGEVLEHIDNPVEFLKIIRESYGDLIDKCIITVPNAFRYSNFKYALKGQEGINSDHRYWFTPYTLCKVCNQAGIEVEELYLTDCSFGRLRKVIKRFYPSHLFYGNIVFVGKFI